MRKTQTIIVAAALLAGCAAKPQGPVLINASDKAAVQAAMPTVIVQGVVESVNSGESVITINFKDTQDSHFYAVILGSGRDALESAYGGDIAKAITGKTVRVTGSVVPYRGRPEIVISKPDQLTIAG